jgi:hypothetical protein
MGIHCRYSLAAAEWNEVVVGQKVMCGSGSAKLLRCQIFLSALILMPLYLHRLLISS